MEDSESAQIQIQIRMKRSGQFFGNLIAQEFKLKSFNKILSWNESILQTVPKNKHYLEGVKKNEDFIEWNEKDVAQNLTGLQRDTTYEFTIRVITQMSSFKG